MIYLTETRQGRAIAVQHRPDSSWKARQSSVAARGFPSLSLWVFCQDVRLMHGARAGEQAWLQAALDTSGKVSAGVGSLQRGILPDCAATEHIQLVQTPGISAAKSTFQ